MKTFLLEAKKAVAAASSAAAFAVTAGLLTGDLKIYVVGGLGVAASFIATYMATNEAESVGRHAA